MTVLWPKPTSVQSASQGAFPVERGVAPLLVCGARPGQSDGVWLSPLSRTSPALRAEQWSGHLLVLGSGLDWVQRT